MIAGLASSLPKTLASGLQHQGVPFGVAHQIASLPPVSSLFAAVLGVNPLAHLLAAHGVLSFLPAAAAHVAVLDAQIRTLRLRRAVLSTVARGGHSIEETLIMHKLARLSAQERQRIIDDFVDDIFAGTDPDAPAAGRRPWYPASSG